MDEVKEKLLVEASSLFIRFGFKSMTMDDVSRELGISKKTLYQYFSDKNELVNQCVDYYLHTISSRFYTIINNKKLNAISMILNITEEVSIIMQRLNPSSMFDLKKYFKVAWDKLECNRKDFICSSIFNNLELGISQGLYRDDIDVQITAEIYGHLISYLTNPDSYSNSKIDVKTMHKEIIKYHLNSICTSKGRKIIQKYNK